MQAEGLRHPDDGLDDGGVTQLVHRARIPSAHEGLVDLQDIDVEVLEMRQVRVARPEVVDRQPNAERFELIEHAHRVVEVTEHGGLGDLEFEQLGIETGRLEYAGNVPYQIGVAELERGEVDGDHHTVLLPANRVGAGAFEHVLT